MLCVTYMYLRDITNTLFTIVNLNVSHLSVCSSCYVFFFNQHREKTRTDLSVEIVQARQFFCCPILIASPLSILLFFGYYFVCMFAFNQCL